MGLEPARARANHVGIKDILVGGYSILLGLAVIGLWAPLLLGAEVPEGPTEMAFHLASEGLMALGCVLSGVLLLRARPLGRRATAAAHAMVVYSTLNAAGYYAERGDGATATAMVALTLISAGIVVLHLRRC